VGLYAQNTKTVKTIFTTLRRKPEDESTKPSKNEDRWIWPFEISRKNSGGSTVWGTTLRNRRKSASKGALSGFEIVGDAKLKRFLDLVYSGQWYLKKNATARRIKGSELNSNWQDPLALHLDSPTGALLGESEQIRPTADQMPVPLRVPLRPTSGLHDVYVVFGNPDAKGDGFMFGVLTATFEAAPR